MNRPHLIISTLAFIGLAACTGTVGVQPGDAVIPPAADDPEFQIVVLAADDLGTLDATVAVDGLAQSAPDGLGPTVLWQKTPVQLDVAADGFLPVSFTVESFPDAGKIEFLLEPVVLQGRISTNTGRPLPGVTVKLGSVKDTTDNEGGYALERAVPGMIELSRSAWASVEYQWSGVVHSYDMAMEPVSIRALRLSADDLSDTQTWDRVIDLADSTEVNGLVIELKTEDGTVVYSSEVAKATAIGAVRSYFDIDRVVADAKEHDLYLIGRVVVFQDNLFATAEPDHAVVTEDGALWRSRSGFAWLDPSDPASFEYSIQIAEEACRRGFDEIQFDYVSYPVGGDLTTATFDGEYNQEVRIASIDAFLTRASSVLHSVPCTISTTVLGIVLESSSDEGVGQRPASMSRIVDVITPTLYSTNYGSGWKNYEDPNAHAVEIVGSALVGGLRKLDGSGYLRPWLQTWAITPAEQRAVQMEVEDLGMGWMLWSNAAKYERKALP